MSRSLTSLVVLVLSLCFGQCIEVQGLFMVGYLTLILSARKLLINVCILRNIQG